MRLPFDANRFPGLRRFTFRAVLIGSVGIPLVVVSQDIKIEIRPRTDRHVQDDIRRALEFQKRLLSAQDSKGLSDLSQSIQSSSSHLPNRSNVVVSDSVSPLPSSPPTGDAYPCPPIVIGSSGNDASIAPRVEKGLPPPTISQIQGWQPEQRRVSETDARIASNSRQWRPVRAVIGANDVEATIPPQLSGSVTVGPTSQTDSRVVPANFQATGDGMNTPFLPPGTSNPGIAPNLGSPSMSTPVMPGSSPSNVMPAPPVTYAPNGLTPAPLQQGGLQPYNPGTLPTYPPPRSSTIISGEPFVTAAPCQFDAYYMVEPAVSMQNPCASTCGPGYSGIPGNIAPPTVMPNQVPPGIYSPNNSGFRPLFGFGQDNYNVQLGRGIIGQPVAYVPGQPFRNFLRYIFP